MRSLIRVIYLFTDSYQENRFVLPPRRRSRPANVSFVHTRPASTRCFCVNSLAFCLQVAARSRPVGEGFEPAMTASAGPERPRARHAQPSRGGGTPGPQNEPSGET